MVSLFSQYLYLACPNQSQSMFCSRRLHFLRKTISFPSHKQGSFSSSTSIISCSSTSWNPFQRVMAAALDKLEASMIASQLQHLPSTADPGIQLEGNFAPVEERGVEDEIEVKDGKIPECLEGVYVRNGANPMLQPLAGHHLFDGDGMLHALRFKHGKASYCCRFTRTNRLVQEEKMGKPIFPKAIGELHGHNGVGRLLLFYVRSLLGLVDGRQGMGTANAGVLFFNGRLLAMSEDDLPYAVRITSSGDLVTLGRYDFGGQLKSSMIAHPKIDAKTGEMFGLSYDVVKKPYLRYFKFSGDGVKSRDVAITLSEPTMIHDFAITENFVVIPDQQIVFRVQEMLRGGSPVVQNKSKVSRFGILPRNDSDESRIRWVEVPDCFCFHLWNAWEEGEEVVVIGSCMTPPDLIFNESPEQQPLRSVLSEIRVNRGRGTSERRVIVGGMNLEAGQVNGMVVGRKSRYAYMAIAEPWPKVCGIAKVDLVEMKVVAERRYEDGCYGGEPTFVANSHNIDAAEDNGFVLTFLHKEGSRESELLIMDAKSPRLHTIASLRLPSRVPYGFHGTFVSSQQLLHQKQTLL